MRFGRSGLGRAQTMPGPANRGYAQGGGIALDSERAPGGRH
jgi:hypothetical protein